MELALSSTTTAMECIVFVKRAVPIALLALFWCVETWRPFFDQREGRWKHAARNLGFSVFNTLILGMTFVSVTMMVANWTEQKQYGLLHAIGVSRPLQFGLALVLLDAWMYVWHRANHAIPLLWRFHRMHHSDRHMDVTTATRFHLGEHIGSWALRLGLIPLLGLEIWNLIVYDSLVLAITQFHHANISIGPLDRALRWLIVTPSMHKVHHSAWQPETDSNYSTVLSVWDRMAGTFRMRLDLKSITFGLHAFADPASQSWWGMWRTPLMNPTSDSALETSQTPGHSSQGSDDPPVE